MYHVHVPESQLCFDPPNSLSSTCLVKLAKSSKSVQASGAER